MYLTLDIGVWGPNVSRLLGGCFTLTFPWRRIGALEGWRPDRTAARTWRWDGDTVGAAWPVRSAGPHFEGRLGISFCLSFLGLILKYVQKKIDMNIMNRIVI